ncbi:hypothetical protein H336_15285 [Vibrio parahaemolyticus EN9701072]|nr:hypothetical protein H331_09170 [Vibrio parahaemolyticus 3644]KIT58957.1 hypothetical protein H336_15285 [Vibrio parahaemolyticus EN9701072]TOH52464.1 hypothetical protein CGI79_22870 [Vibrio parahaemolyticus]
MPTKLVKNAVFKPDNKDSMLPSILEGSNSIKPTTIPAKVPKIPKEVRMLVVLAVNLGAFPRKAKILEAISRKKIV